MPFSGFLSSPFYLLLYGYLVLSLIANMDSRVDLQLSIVPELQDTHLISYIRTALLDFLTLSPLSIND